MGDMLGSKDGYTRQRYEAALRGDEYTALNRGGIVEIAELYCSTPGNGANGRALGVVASCGSIESIDGCVSC